jgi:hypothetical protein
MEFVCTFKRSKISKSYFPFFYLNALTYWNVTVEEHQQLISVNQIRIFFLKQRFFSSMLENGDDYIQVENIDVLFEIQSLCIKTWKLDVSAHWMVKITITRKFVVLFIS